MKSRESDSKVPPIVRGVPKRRLIWRRLLLLFAGVVVIVAGVRALAPLLVERGVAFGSRHYLGLPARVDNVDLSLLKGIVVLEGVSLGAEPDGVSPGAAAIAPPPIAPSGALLHLERISARLSWRDLFQKTIRLAEVTVESPSLRILREDDGGVDPLRHAKPVAVPSKKNAASTSEPWAVEIGWLALRTPNAVLADPANGRNPIEFSLESFELENVAFRGGDFALGAVGIRGPVLRVRKDLVLGGSGNAKPAVDDAKSAAASRTRGYRVKKIDIERAKFTWVTEEGPLDVMMTLRALDITADEGARFPIDLALKIANADIRAAGDVGIFPLGYTGTLSWDGLPLPPLLLASAPGLAPWLRSADSSGDLKVDADIAGAHGPPTVKLSGRATVESLELADPGDREFSLGWKRLEAVIGGIALPILGDGKSARTTKVDFDLIRLVEPKVRYTHPSPALNAMLGAPAGGSSGSTTKPASSRGAGASPAGITVAEFEVVGGDVEIRDTTVKPAAVTTIRDLSVTARSLHFPDPAAEAIAVRATLPTDSLLVIEGRLKPGSVGDFSVVLERLDLPTFNSYAAAAGASLDAGRISLKTRLQTRGATVRSDNDLVLQKFGISLRDPTSFSREFGMPIDLALALMSDPSGDIRLKIPIIVDEKGTTVAARTVIASALKAALLGAVSTPLKLLGATSGNKSGPVGDGVIIAPIGSRAGRAEPSPDAPARVAGLVKLLAQRPAMGLVLRGRIGPEDRPAVAEQVLLERIKAGQKLPEPGGAGFLARQRIGHILSNRARGNTAGLPDKDQVLLDRYLGAVGDIGDRLDALAKSRAEKLRDMIVASGLSAKLVTIGNREADGPPGVVISIRRK